MLAQRHELAVHVDLREPLLPVGVVRPGRIGIRQVPVLDAPMDAVPVCSSNDSHAMRVAHDYRAASPGHVAADAVAGVLAYDAAVEDLERPDLDLAPLVDKLDAVRLQLQQLVERERVHAGKLRRPGN